MQPKKQKTPKQLERHMKGTANHRRIEILFLVATREGIAVDEITETLGANFKTVSGHTQRLVYAGLLNKSYKGQRVMHRLSPYGRRAVAFLRSFQ